MTVLAVHSSVMTSPHPRFVRWTHWLTALACLALLVSGVEITLSHPRFYWGETGNANMIPAFTLPVPSSRSLPTGYDFILPDANGWSRSLHVQGAWLVLIVGVIYVWVGARTGHFRRVLLSAQRYNPLQRRTYVAVIFGLVPLVIWTGLAMAPAWAAVAPWSVTLLGGRQSARTWHFAAMTVLVAFTIGHVIMVARAGFVERVRAMLVDTGIPSS
jgi:thiosulfate reductase cytochrome b subunit